MIVFLLAIILMFVFFFLGTPIAFSMLIMGLFWLIAGGFPGGILLNLNILATKTGHAINSFPLLAIPFFMLAANAMNSSKVTDSVFKFAGTLVNHKRGGLGQVNILASMIFAGMSGSGVADAAGLGKVEVKAMMDAGVYDKPFITCVTASSAALGPIIPPSISFIILAAVTYISAGKLLIGGLLPGITMGIVLMLMVSFLSHRRGYPRGEKASLAEVFKMFKETFWALLTPLVLLGGIFSGFFTPTEAAAVSALYAILVGIFVYRGMRFIDLYKTFVVTANFTAKILFVVAAAGIVGRLFAMANIPSVFANFITDTFSQPILALFFVATFCFLLGCIIDDLSLILILAPIFTPAMIGMGVDPVHWGVIFIMAINLGMITPPVGYVMFVTRTWTNISLAEYTKEILWFAVPLFILTLCLILIPKLVLFLPNALM